MFNKTKNKKQNPQQQPQDPNILTFLNGNAVNYPKVKYPTIFLQTKIQKQYPYLQFENYIYPTQPAVIDIKYCCLSNFHPDVKTKQISFKIIKENLQIADTLILKMQQQQQHPQLIKYISKCLQGAILNQNQQFSLTINGLETLFDTIDIKHNNIQITTAIITQNTQIILQEDKQKQQNAKDKYFDIKMKSYSKQLQNLVNKIINNQYGKYLLYGLPGQGKTNIFYWLQQQDYDIQFIQPQDDIQKLTNHKILIADEIDSWSSYQIQTLFTSLNNKILIGTTNRPETISADFDEKIEIIADNQNKIYQIIGFLFDQNLCYLDEQQILQKLTELNFQQVIESFSPADIQIVLNNIEISKDIDTQSSEQQNNTLDLLLSQIKQQFINSTPTFNNQYSICNKQDLIYFQDEKSQQMTEKLNLLLQNQNYQTFLLYGLPGTGKGLFIRYFSNLSNISIITVNSTEIVSPYVGQTELNLKRIFQSKAKIIFFDECDSLLSGNSGSSKRVIQTFIANIERHEQIIICATNRPWLLTDQIINRFDNKLFYTYNSQIQSQNMLLNQLQEYIQNNIDENDMFQQSMLKESTKNMTNSMVVEVISKMKEIMIKQNKLEITLDQVLKMCQQVKKSKQISEDELNRFEEFNKKYINQEYSSNSDVESE